MDDSFGLNGHDGFEDGTEEEALLIGMQVLHGEAIAPYTLDEFSGGSISVLPDLPVTVSNVQIDGALMNAYTILKRAFPPNHLVVLVPPDGESTMLPLSALPDVMLDDMAETTLLVMPLDKMDALRSPHTLQYLVARLRDEDGCPWDRKQTHASLRDAVINEAYEVLDAIDDEDWDNLAEELGDLYLIVAMQAQIAEEAREFILEDVFEHVSAKIIRRHPHVFGDEVADDPEAVVQTWNAVKAREKAEGPPRRDKEPDGQPRSMPALTRAANVLRKRPLPTDAAIESPGDRLLAAVATIVADGGDPEVALRDALARHVASSSHRTQ
jgi:tetrapyrrole methylase family protein/MazG family protein